MNDRKTVLYLVIIALVCLIVGISLSGCARTVENVDSENTVMYVNTGAYNATLDAWVYVVTDKDTGVQYIVTRDVSVGAVSVCPRYGSDGEIAATGQVE